MHISYMFINLGINDIIGGIQIHCPLEIEKRDEEKENDAVPLVADM